MAEKTEPTTRRAPASDTVERVSVSAVTAQADLDAENEARGTVTTDPTARARAVDAGVKVDPRTGRISQRGPAGPEVYDERVTATSPLFVRVDAPEGGKRRLLGEDTPDDGSLVLYLPGDTIPPEHRDLPTVAAVHRRGVWEPAG
jgi:hypothetical protein